MNIVKYDYLIVGAGLYGATFAEQMKSAGKHCLVIDKREHIAGNCYTYEWKDSKGISINIHKYGPHIFHTSNKDIWEYVQRFAGFNHFSYRPKVSFEGELYSFPINMMTFYQLWGCKKPAEAKRKIEEVRVPIENPANMKEYILSQLGEEIYHKFFEGYTTKQWGRDPSLLPASIVKRLPVRFTYDDNYYRDVHQGIPQGGYTKMVGNMLEGVDVQLGLEYDFKLNSLARKVVYTGPIDQFFNYSLGHLEYRSLEFSHWIEAGDYQGVAGINHTGMNVQTTRSIEHKYFEFVESDESVVTHEFPRTYSRDDCTVGRTKRRCSPCIDKSHEHYMLLNYEDNEPYYPINDDYNNALYKRYEEETLKYTNFIFGGRLANYRYLDMHQVINMSLVAARRELNG